MFLGLYEFLTCHFVIKCHHFVNVCIFQNLWHVYFLLNNYWSKKCRLCTASKKSTLVFSHIFLPLFLAQKKLWRGKKILFSQSKNQWYIFCPHATLAFRRVKWKVEDDKRRNPRIPRSSALQPIGVFLSSSSKSAASADQRTTVQRQTVPRSAVTLVIWRRKRRP